MRAPEFPVSRVMLSRDLFSLADEKKLRPTVVSLMMYPQLYQLQSRIPC